MIVSVALAWYDEPPELLSRCVRSCAVIADRIVALDGAYARFPGARVVSPPEQAEAIREAAADVGLELILEQPTRLWAGQVEKRSALIARGAEGSDWVQVVDADHVLQGTRETVRQALAEARADVYEVPFFTPANPDLPIGDTAAHEWHAGMAGRMVPMALVYRALPDMRYESYHWWLSAEKNGQRVWLWGNGPGTHARVEAFPDPTYRIDHLTLHRDRAHVLASRAFCNDREMVVRMPGQEDDRPELPRPVWDFARMARG